jgi:hypothetical protein
MAGKGLREGSPVPHEATDRAPDEPAPLFGRWSVWYGLVAIELGLVIALCGWIAHRYR